MKKYHLITIVMLYFSNSALTQSGLIDPYRLNLVNFQNIGPIPVYTNSSMQIVYDSQLIPGPGGYDGEYMIGIRDHPLGIPAIINNHALKYKMEVVSFPFTINCWNDNGCPVQHWKEFLKCPMSHMIIASKVGGRFTII